MKAIFLAIVFCFVYCLVCLGGVNPDYIENKEVASTELNSGVAEFVESFIEKSNNFADEKIKIVIYNEALRKVRVEVIDKMEDINLHSTLFPIFHSTDLITTIDNVSYYLLRK